MVPPFEVLEPFVTFFVVVSIPIALSCSYSALRAAIAALLIPFLPSVSPADKAFMTPTKILSWPTHGLLRILSYLSFSNLSGYVERAFLMLASLIS
jgi:hypothetical protein